MPVVQFLSEFIPEASEERPANNMTFSHTSVSENEDTFVSLPLHSKSYLCSTLSQIRAIEESGFCPKLKFINTTHRPDGPYRLTPDISIYSGDISAAHGRRRPLDWKTVDLLVENKNNSDDIFRAVVEIETREENDGISESHVKEAHYAQRICGRLFAYASELHRSQFRVFSFAVVLFGNTGRLLRWDRSGVIYTEAFNWANEPDTLFEFFWRLNFLSDVERGYDTTVTSVDEEEDAKTALSNLRKYKGLEHVQRADLFNVFVHDDRARDGQPRSYITPGPVWLTDALFGRCTFGYIAYDVAGSRLVYLKDFWRTDLPDIQKEGDVYRELHDAQVPNIPMLGPAGDVPLSLDHEHIIPFSSQRTRTQDYVKVSGLGYEWCPGRPRVDPLVHYRLVLDTLGYPLNTFKSTRQLCEVIRDAIVGA